MAFTAKTDWIKGEELPHSDMNRIEQGIEDAYKDIGKKLDKIANAASATKLKTPRKINGVDFDGSSDITIPVEDMGYQVFKPTLLGTWVEHPTFGECLAVKVGRICTVSGWLTGGDPWDDKNSLVIQLPTECRPTRDIFVNVSTKGAMMSAMIMHDEGELWLIPSDSGERPSISSDMVAFTVTYVIIDPPEAP